MQKYIQILKRGLLKAKLCYSDLSKPWGEQNCKEKGKLRLEGKEYVVEDGDIIHFKFNLRFVRGKIFKTSFISLLFNFFQFFGQNTKIILFR